MQEKRIDLVRIKLSAIGESVKDKRIVLIDDSIVRGTTSGQIVNLLREAGAKEVHMRISSPPFLYPCYYGTDIDSCENLIACHHSVEEIADITGADSLGYLPEAELKNIVGGCEFCARASTEIIRQPFRCYHQRTALRASSPSGINKNKKSERKLRYGKVV